MSLINNINTESFNKELRDKKFVVVDNFLKDYVCYLICRRMQLEKNFQDYYKDYQNINFDITDQFTKDLSDQIIQQYNLLKRFERAWSNIYNTKGLGTDLHVDPGSDLTMNVWVTPTESIVDVDKNGLILSTTYYDGDHDLGEPQEFIEKNKMNFTHIPYKYNRAIFFQSKLLHKTSGVETLDGPFHRRVSYTMLFRDV